MALYGYDEGDRPMRRRPLPIQAALAPQLGGFSQMAHAAALQRSQMANDVAQRNLEGGPVGLEGGPAMSGPARGALGGPTEYPPRPMPNTKLPWPISGNGYPPGSGRPGEYPPRPMPNNRLPWPISGNGYGQPMRQRRKSQLAASLAGGMRRRPPLY